VKPFDRTLYPFAEHWFDRGAGLRMHYVDEQPAGEAQGTVLMLHGNPSWSFYWRNLVRELSKTHRCIAPDHIGMGMSDKPSDSAYDYSLARRVEDVGKLVDSLQVKGPLTLVVHDWGGMIGLAWAVRHPEKIARLVILNTAAFPLPKTKKLPWQLKLTRTPLGALLVRGMNAFAFGATVSGMTRRKMTAAEQAGYLAPYDSWQDRIATLRFVQDIPLTPGSPGFDIVEATAAELPKFLATPTFIGWGARDFVFDDHFLAEWRLRLPNATVRYLEDAGHYVLEDAADELVPEIAAFVRQAA
jgi:pimeloyl-ACP methyl ester carboxylesterase